MRMSERFERMEEKILTLEKELAELKAGAEPAGKAQTEAKAEKADAPKTKKSAGK